MVLTNKHMTESQLMPEDKSCRICGFNERLPIIKLQEKPQVWLLKCQNCHAASASRIPRDEALEAFYQNYYESDRHVKTTFQGTERFARYLFSRIKNKHRKSHLKILDFGGGDGSISIEIADKLLNAGMKYIDITVVDYNKILAGIDRPHISLKHRKSLDDLPTEKYDLILASAIIEHLPRPKETVIHLIRLLNDGGIFYARTPYAVPLIKLYKILGKKWNFMYPMHLYDLGSDFWNPFLLRMSFNEHFEIMQSRPSVVQSLLKYRFIITLASYAFKAPWYLLGNRYRLVGGWEIFIRKLQVSS